MAPKATGEFLLEAAPSTQFLPTFPKAFHLYPLETAPHSLNSPSRGKKVKRRRRRRGNRALTHFVMPFDHTFIYKTDGCPLSCLYQCMLIFWEKGVQRLGLAYLESQILKKELSYSFQHFKRKLNCLPSPMISMSTVKCFTQKVKDNFHSHKKIIYTWRSIAVV